MERSARSNVNVCRIASMAYKAGIMVYYNKIKVHSSLLVISMDITIRHKHKEAYTLADKQNTKIGVDSGRQQTKY